MKSTSLFGNVDKRFSNLCVAHAVASDRLSYPIGHDAFAPSTAAIIKDIIIKANVEASKLCVPILLQLGLKDLVADPKASYALFSRLDAVGVAPLSASALHGIEVCWHGLLLEPEWFAIVENAGEWVSERCRVDAISNLD